MEDARGIDEGCVWIGGELSYTADKEKDEPSEFRVLSAAVVVFSDAGERG